MTSSERHQQRYLRRKAKRDEKKHKKLAKYDNIETVYSFPHLIRAHLDSRRSVLWKASVARYDMYFLRYTAMQSKNIQAMNTKEICLGFYSFVIYERGKRRDIHSLHYRERVIRRSACINSFVPILSNGLIYDNGASIKGKGVDFALRRCITHLHKFYNKEHNNEGYVLMIDFKSYFANIEYKHLFEIFDKNFHDENLNKLAKSFVLASHMDKGIYIGPEDSQIYAVAFPSVIDHLIKDVWRVPFYGRYMDDSYILCKTKEEAKRRKELLLLEFNKIGIVVNNKKTQIIKLSRGFTFLKVKLHLTQTGKVIKRADHGSIVRQRRKLKKFKKLLDSGAMSMEDINHSYMSWRGYISKKHAWKTIQSMDKLYFHLFAARPWKIKKGR